MRLKMKQLKMLLVIILFALALIYSEPKYWIFLSVGLIIWANGFSKRYQDYE